MGEAWAEFIGHVAARDWVRIVTRRGPQAALQAYGDVLAGHSEPRTGLMLDMRA